MRALFLFSALLLAPSLQAQSSAEMAIPESRHPYIITAGVSLINLNAGVEYGLSNKLHLVINGGVGMNYLLAGSNYDAFKAYPNGKPANASALNLFGDLGALWPSLYVAPELRYYFRKSTDATSFMGWYTAFKYRLSGRGPEGEEPTGFLSSLPPVKSYFRSAHKMGLVVGNQHFIGRRQHTMLQVSGGLGPVFNHNFSYVDLGLFADFGFQFVLARK